MEGMKPDATTAGLEYVYGQEMVEVDEHCA
jgi:hypothetical protein